MMKINLLNKIKNTISLLLISFLFLFLSCSTPSPRLQIAPFEIRSDNDPGGLSVNENGIIKFQNEVIGAIKSDGTVFDNDNKLVATFKSDQTLGDESSKPRLTISKNGQVSNKSVIISSWTEKGEFVNGPEPTGFTIVPVDKNLFQTASVVMVLFFGIE